MKFPRFSPLPAIAAFLLAGCAASLSSHTVTYDLAFNVTEARQIEDLTQAAMRVIERRLDAMGVVNAGKEFGTEGTPSLVITVPDKEGADELSRQLAEPFAMDVMRQAQEGETPDVTVEGHGGFMKTDVSTFDFLGVQVARDGDKAAALIVMTDAGRAKLEKIFQEQVGRNVGVFVRDRLVSKLNVTEGSLTENLQIRNIPSLLVAEAFMDDVNVGLHVVYTPRP